MSATEDPAGARPAAASTTPDIRRQADDHVALARRVADDLLPDVEAFGRSLIDALAAGRKLVVFGNGGSAADAQHFSAELTGHFVAPRGPLPAVALTTDSSALTAIGNDYAWEDVFARQVRGLAARGDVVVGISTSGRAENVVRGLQTAAELGARTVALTGGDGGRLAPVADLAIVVPSDVTARIQEMHILVIHLVCALVDERFGDRDGRATGSRP